MNTLKNLYHQSLHSYSAMLNRVLQEPGTVLDVGCGVCSPLRHADKMGTWIGVDAHYDSVIQSKKERIHDSYLVADIRSTRKIFGDQSFDYVVLLDVLEHLSKNYGRKLLSDLENVARKAVIVFTPNGYVHQEAINNNPWQRHLSGWTYNEMRSRSYHVWGVHGLKGLRTELAQMKFKPQIVWRVLSDISQVYTKSHPRYAFQILCVKDVSSAKTKERYFNLGREEMVKFIPKNVTQVLDVGCATGNFGKAIKEKLNAEVWGIELDGEAAKLASSCLDRVLHGDIRLLFSELPNNYFDCVVFNDVLEHVDYPNEILQGIQSKLTSNGVIVASLPNIRYYPVLIDLVLRGNWEYTESGVLDRTHLRFFTQNSIESFFRDCEYALEHISGINELQSWALTLLNILFFGKFKDSRYIQFACVARPSSQS